MNIQAKLFIYLYWILAIIHICADLVDWIAVVYWSKPPLMLILATYFFLKTTDQKSSFRTIILIALLFASVGDTLLMFRGVPPDTQNLLFLGGLSAFLITHVCYTVGFWNATFTKQGAELRKSSWVIPLFLIYWLAFNYLMAPRLGEMKIPVIVYSLVITVMAISVFRFRMILSARWFGLLLSGVLLFILSDTLIAVNKFIGDLIQLPKPRLLIMTTYLLGQYLIVMGCLKVLRLSKRLVCDEVEPIK